MPLLTGYGLSPSATARTVQIGDAPLFNAGDPAFTVQDIDGWDSFAAPDVVMVANGGGAGSVASGPWLPVQAAYTVSGTVFADPGSQATVRRLIWQAFPPGQDGRIVVYGVDEPDLQAFVRLSERAEFHRSGRYMLFSLPLIAGDPYKYALTPLTGTMGVWTGEDWYLSLTEAPAGVWSVQMVNAGGWSVSLVQDVPDGPYPISLSLDSDGDTSSQRVTASITGPLDAGDWFLWSETTGAQLWADVGITADQTLILDSFSKTATLSGQDVTYLTYGDWLTLEPGSNSFRLVAGTDSDAFCALTALEAYE